MGRGADDEYGGAAPPRRGANRPKGQREVLEKEGYEAFLGDDLDKSEEKVPTLREALYCLETSADLKELGFSDQEVNQLLQDLGEDEEAYRKILEDARQGLTNRDNIPEPPISSLAKALYEEEAQRILQNRGLGAIEISRILQTMGNTESECQQFLQEIKEQRDIS